MSEWDEAEKDVKAAEAAKAKSGSKPTNGRTNGRSNPKQQDFLNHLFSPVFLEAFVLTFCAEWGDRSQIATIGKPAVPPIGKQGKSVQTTESPVNRQKRGGISRASGWQNAGLLPQLEEPKQKTLWVDAWR